MAEEINEKNIVTKIKKVIKSLNHQPSEYQNMNLTIAIMRLEYLVDNFRK